MEERWCGINLSVVVKMIASDILIVSRGGLAVVRLKD